MSNCEDPAIMTMTTEPCLLKFDKKHENIFRNRRLSKYWWTRI